MTVQELAHLIDGRWVDGSGPEFSSTNPAHPQEVVARGRKAGPDDVERAVAAADAAFAGWAATPYSERGAVLARAAALLEQRAPDLGRELAREEGKTLAEGVGEVQRAAAVLRYCSAEGDREAGQVFHSPRAGQRLLVVRRPVGVVGVVTPFNFPIAIPAWKIGPALVHGNTVVWKPASTVPLLAFRLAQALDEAGLPAGVLNLVLTDGGTGAGVVECPLVHAVTFTGSTQVGRRLAASCAARGVAVQAEMGGKNPAVVLADADLDNALEQVLLGAYRSSGQKCTATSRLVLEEPIAEEFLRRLTERVDALVVGDPLDPRTSVGPLVSPAAAAVVAEGVECALREGARELTAPRSLPAEGHFAAPRVLELPGTGPAVWRDELFGPVLAVVRAADREEAFRLAGDTEFGLTSAVFTRDLGAVLQALETLDVGIVHVNDESAGADPHVPFGGARASGLGPKEQGTASREFFTHTTTVYLRA